MLTDWGHYGQLFILVLIAASALGTWLTFKALRASRQKQEDYGGVVMSTAGQENAMNGLRRSAALAAFRGRYKEHHVPVVIRDEVGLRLRLPGAPRSTAYLKELVALGKSLRADL